MTEKSHLPRAPETLPERMPVLAVRSTVVFPMGATALQVGFAPNVEALAAHPQPETLVAIVSTQEEAQPLPVEALQKVAVGARVLDRLNLPGGTIQVTLQGLWRIRLAEVRFADGVYTARPERVDEEAADPATATELIDHILNVLGGVAARVERVPDEAPRILRMNLTEPGRFADLAATLSQLNVPERDAVLQELRVEHRLRYVAARLDEAWERVREIEQGEEAGAGARPRTPDAIRRQIRTLQTELGNMDPAEQEADQLLRRIDLAQLPTRVAAAARQEANRLRPGASAPSEAPEIRNYLATLLDLPWAPVAPPSPLDLAAVQKALDAEHVGLDETKRRLLEVLSVAALRGDLYGPIPCLTGPPGVGKRSLVAAVARGMGRPLARVELGGRGEGHLAGTRRGRGTGAMGKLVRSLADAGSFGAVLLLAEMDEVGLGSVEGDPVDAVEEFLETREPREWTDRYLDVPVDVSQVFPVATATDFLRIPRDLRERLVEIRIAGYTLEEKVAIASRVLLPRVAREHGLEPERIEADHDSLLYLTRGYARDAGLSGLRRALSAIARHVAWLHASGELERWRLCPDRIEEVLGPPRYVATPAESRPEVGVVTGLAWTAAGGELLLIEALKMRGTGRLIITGLLGEVMRESVDAGYSYVRSRAEVLGIPFSAFGEHDIHVHFPQGATPKDGPSAGAAVTLAIASTLSERPVRHDIAMTGEVTLRGRVLEIGGVKEKTLAAYRAGLREVILPVGNLRDLRDVPKEVRDRMQIHPVDRVDRVFELALLPAGAGESGEEHEGDDGGGAARRQAAAGSGERS